MSERAAPRASEDVSLQSARGAALPFELLIVTDGRTRLIERIERALSGVAPGRVAILLREPQLKTAELVALGRALRQVTDVPGALLLISDRVDVALAVDADGVQLPESGFTPEVARTLLGRHAIIGASRHDRVGLEAAAARGADYATLSPLHAVPGKGTPLGLSGFRAEAAGASLPVYALGGVRVEDVAALRAAGARGVAVMREVLAASDPNERTSQLLAALSASRAPA
ncbi:MAG: thiamine phosphate synthase [Myxococcaceae bacterium]|nr:thiamine phosphate synthase [Myxococcaceae bacterium]